MAKKAPFIFNDESQYNTYRFRVLTDGISLIRFDQNPVMLDGHWNSSHSVIGKWEGYEKDGALLTGVPVFDIEDELGKKIAGKVERGFLKACSMGLLFNPADMVVEANGKLCLQKCELLEVSIVAVPSNANAVRLYVEKDGNIELLKEEDIQQLYLSALNNQSVVTNNSTMKQVFLSVAALVALGLDKHNPSEGVDVSAIENAISNLKSKLENSELKLQSAEAALKTFKDKETAALQAEVKAFVDSVVPSKYDESQREAVTKLANADLGFAKNMAALLPEKQGLSAQVNNETAKAEAAKTGEVKTMDDFQKLSVEQQLAFKNQNKAGYEALIASM